MNSRHVALIGLVVFALVVGLVFVSNPTVAQSTPSKPSATWEYKVADALQTIENLDLGDKASGELIKKSLEQFLNEQGSGGWELVAYSGSMAIYKRKTSN